MAERTLTETTGRIKHDWQGIWLTPALGATAVLVAFLLFFREPGKEAEVSATARPAAPEGPPDGVVGG